MNAGKVGAAARVIHAAMEQGKRTAAGFAIALDSAQLLMSPETAAELERLRLNERAATSDAEAAEQSRGRWRTAAIEAERERDALRTRVAELESGLPAMQEALLKALDRVSELESERHSTNEALDDAVQALRATREPVAEDVTPQVRRLRALLAGQREAVDGEHYPVVHHAYRVPRDLPEMGGA